MGQVIQTLDQHSCLSKLLRLNYVIVYKPTRTNKVVDAYLEMFSI